MIDELFRLVIRTAQLFRKAKGRYAVYDAEINRLGTAAQIGRHIGDGRAKHLGCGKGVNIDAVRKCGAQSGNARHFRHQAQFDLRIIRRQQFAIWRGDKGSADFFPLDRADGDVLQIGIAAGKTAGIGQRHMKTGMHAAGFGIDLFNQCIGIG